MELHKIESLLEKYFSGETSVAEEKELQNYFSSPNVAPHLDQYRALFGFFQEAKKEQFNRSLPLKPRKRNYVKWISIAACVALLAGFYFYMNPKPTQNQTVESLGTFDDPQLAFTETKKALEMVSKNVNTGVKSMNYIQEYDKTTKTIFK